MIKFTHKVFETGFRWPKFPKIRIPKTVMQLVLTIAGFGMVSYGIGLIYVPAGVVLGGISLLLLERGLADE